MKERREGEPNTRNEMTLARERWKKEKQNTKIIINSPINMKKNKW